MLLSNAFESDSRVHKEARSAVSAGFSVTVLALPKAGLPAVEHRDGFQIRRLGRPGGVRVLRRLAWYGHCLWYCLVHRGQIIHVNDLDPLFVGWIAARLIGAGLVYDSHELWSHGQAIARAPRPARWFIRKLERFLARRTDANFQADQPRAAMFEREYKLPAPRALRNCPPLQVAAPNRRLRSLTGTAEQQKLVVYSGNIGPGRGVASALAALDHLPNDVHVVFLGYGRTDWIREFQATATHGNRVHLVPAVPFDDIVPMLAGADIGVALIENTSLSYYLGAPTKLFEYMMAGLPVVGSDLPGIATVIRDADFGLVVDPREPKQIAKAIRTLLEDRALHDRFRDNALRATSRYNWENESRGLIDVYRDLAARRPA